MVKSVKSNLRRIYRATAEWPIVGRLVRIGGAAARLPEIKGAVLTLIERQPVDETERVPPSVTQNLSDLDQRQRAFDQRLFTFEMEQLPTLLQTVADINQRQLASDNDRDNLVKSVPVALRKITREIVEVRTQIESLNIAAERVRGVPDELKRLADSMEQRIQEVQGQTREVARLTDE